MSDLEALRPDHLEMPEEVPVDEAPVEKLDKDTKKLAGAAYHPAWQKVLEDFDTDIADARALKNIQNAGAMSDAELGGAVRVELLYANKLETFKERIINAVKAVEDEQRRKAKPVED